MPYSSDEILNVLRIAGFEAVSQRGSHLKLRRAAQVVILKHPTHDVPAGTFAAILKQAGLTRTQFDQLRRRQ